MARNLFRFRIPIRPLGRVRMAFLGLGAITIGLGVVALLIREEPAPLPRYAGMAALGTLTLVWVGRYRTGRSLWWLEPLASVALTAYALALPVPAFALGAFYVHLYITALYGGRWTAASSIVLTLLAYWAASAVALGSLVAALTSPILVFQVPALALTGGIMRLLYEALKGQEKLARRVEEASRMEAVGRLTGGIAHDFNNMLTAIMGSIELALLDVDESSPIRADLVLASQTAQRAGALTQQLLTFSKRKVMRPVNLEVNQTLREIQGMLSRMAGEGVRLQLVLEPTERVVHIDPSSFEQVVMNLVVNGSDAIGDAGGSVVIRTARVRADDALDLDSGTIVPSRPNDEPRAESVPGHYVMIEVTDDGRGMDDATRAKVFEPFFTTRSEGTGLGLSTVYGVVTGTGGHVTIDSEPGQGTSVRVFLPLAPEAQIEETAPAPHAAASTGSPARVLVVDDERGVREVMQRVLEKGGFSVVAVGDADQALAAFDRDDRGFDLVITDLSLPGMSGAELAERLRERRPDLPLLLTSGYSESSVEGALKRLPQDPFLEKPFGGRELLEAVGTLVSVGTSPVVR